MLNKDFFINNRNKLFNSMDDNSLLILFSGNAPKKSLDEQYPFSINRNFYYETGVNEENDILLLTKINNTPRAYLFIARIDETKSKWVGKTLTINEAKEISGINNVFYLDQFDQLLGEYLTLINKVYLDLEKQSFEERLTNSEIFMEELKEEYSNIEIKDAFPIIAKHRMVKEDCEVALIQKAINITKIGIETLMKNAKSGIYEYQLEACFDYIIKRNGASGFAFKTIAASGKNGAILHYVANNSKIEKDSLILFDLGAEYQLYKSDITRTFPIDGKFTNRQKEIYDIVLRGQELVINSVKPGLTLMDLNNILVKFYIEELKRINLIQNDEEVRKYYYHGVSHHLGLDTHDASLRNEPLVKGAVITVEPGLYIEEENIGIRIENDVLVTEDGCIDLAKNIISSIDDIEEFMKKNKNSI